MSDENVVTFAPPNLNASQPEEVPAPERKLTRGERLVGVNFNPSGDFAVKLTKHRHAKTIDALANLPINILTAEGQGPSQGQKLQYMDLDHKGILEEAIRRQVDAAMWAVKALTWGK